MICHILEFSINRGYYINKDIIVALESELTAYTNSNDMEYGNKLADLVLLVVKDGYCISNEKIFTVLIQIWENNYSHYSRAKHMNNYCAFGTLLHCFYLCSSYGKMKIPLKLKDEIFKMFSDENIEMDSSIEFNILNIFKVYSNSANFSFSTNEMNFILSKTKSNTSNIAHIELICQIILNTNFKTSFNPQPIYDLLFNMVLSEDKLLLLCLLIIEKVCSQIWFINEDSIFANLISFFRRHKQFSYLMLRICSEYLSHNNKEFDDIPKVVRELEKIICESHSSFHQPSIYLLYQLFEINERTIKLQEINPSAYETPTNSFFDNPSTSRSLVFNGIIPWD